MDKITQSVLHQTEQSVDEELCTTLYYWTWYHCFINVYLLNPVLWFSVRQKEVNVIAMLLVQEDFNPLTPGPLLPYGYMILCETGLSGHL